MEKGSRAVVRLGGLEADQKAGSFYYQLFGNITGLFCDLNQLRIPPRSKYLKHPYQLLELFPFLGKEVHCQVV
jgi:hypothetical protein